MRVLTALKTTLAGHTEALGRYIDRTEGGGVLEAAKEALGSALGVAAGLYDQIWQAFTTAVTEPLSVLLIIGIIIIQVTVLELPTTR